MTSAATTATAYAAVGVLAVTLQVLGVLRPARFPTLARVLTWAMRRRSTQLGLVFAWWWLGWHFLTAR